MPFLSRIAADNRFAVMAFAALTTAYASSWVSHSLPSTLPRLLPLPALPGPAMLSRLASDVDTGVVVLFVPMCALILAITFEVLRLMSRGGSPDDAMPAARSIPHWQDEAADRA